MEKPTSASRLVTAQYDFGKVSFDGENLFSMRGGVPMNEAFNELSVLLSAVQGVVNALEDADGECVDASYAASRLIDLSQALLQSMHSGFAKYEKPVCVGGGAA